MSGVRTEPREDRPGTVPASGIRTYVLLWISQWWACAATSSTVFVVSVNVFREFESIWMIVIGYAIMFVPCPVMYPYVGAFVDRYGQRPALLISNIGTLVNLSILALVMATGTGGVLYAVSAVGLSRILSTFQVCAIESVVPLLVPKRHYGRANGPRMLMTGTFVLAGPLLITLLLGVFTPVQIVFGECALVALAILVVLTVRIPAVQAPSGDAVRPSLNREVVQAWQYLRSRRGLLTMVGFLGFVSAVLGAIEVAASGAVMGFASETGAIVVSTSGWLGMVVASVAMTVWGVHRRLVPGLLGAGLVFALALCVAAFRPNLILMSVGAFAAMAGLAVIFAHFQTVMHLKVEPHLLGRVMGMKNTAATVGHIVGDVGAMLVGLSLLVSSGKTAGGGVWGWRVGEGWADVNSPVLAAFIGDGPGRGWALFLMLIGLAVAAYVAFLRFRSPGLTRLEDDLPDVTPEDGLRQSTGDPVPVGVTESAPGYRLSV